MLENTNTENELKTDRNEENTKDAGMMLDEEELDQVSGGLNRQTSRPMIQSTVLKGQKVQYTSTPYSGGKVRIKQCGSLDDLLSGEDSFGSGQGPVKC